MLELGNIVTQSCLNVAPPATAAPAACSDAAYALANPTICGANLQTLILKPSTAICCLLGSIQLTAIVVQNGVETDVTAKAVFTTSDPDIAVVGASSGNVTGLAGGDVVINASYINLTATCSLTVIGETHCCDAIPVAFMVLVDDSKSMSQPFNGAYASKLVFGKSAASQFIASVNANKDSVGLISFDDSFAPVLSAPSSNIAAVSALVSGIAQSQQLTGYNAALIAAINSLNATAAIEKIIVLISDGEDTSVNDPTDSADAINTINAFKSSGGIVICLGVRATANNFLFLEALATGGFFINAYDATAVTALQTLMGLKGYICAGNCTPAGDEYVAIGQLDYCKFKNWNVMDGHVDLIGNGFLDFLPGNGLYVDLAGSTAPHGGTMISKNTFNLVAGHNYRLSLELAGNQRINAAPNMVQFAVFSRNTDIIPNPSVAPVVTVHNSGAALSTTPTYKYVYTYVNANGETVSSPVTSVTPTTAGASMVVQCSSNGAATNIKIYRTSGATPDSPFYEIAEIANTAPAYTDYMTLADFEAALVAGTVDACAIAPTDNTTGTPVYYLNQSLTLNNYQQGFTPQSFSFTVPANVNVRVSMQQTSIPSAASAAGLLLDQVSFDDTTDMVNLFNDNFDTENEEYIPPACGIGTTYTASGYQTGYYCYGSGCLNEPPAVQAQDPNPLPSIEAAATTPAQYTSTKTVCLTCPDSSTQISDYTLPAPQSITGGTQWNLAAAVEVVKLCWTFSVSGSTSLSLTMQGSNDGTTWTTIGSTTATLPHGTIQTGSCTTASPAASYSYYRLLYDTTHFTLNAVGSTAQIAVNASQVCATASASSLVSQADADGKATASATTQAQLLLDCIPSWTATEFYTATCAADVSIGSFGQSATQSATYTSFISLLDAQTQAGILAKAAAIALLSCNNSNNGQQIVINDDAAATPYPSVQFVSGKTGLVTKVTVSVNLFSHARTSDVQLVLRSPDGTLVLLMWDCGGSHAASNVNLVFDDAAGSSLTSAAIVSGTYKPTSLAAVPNMPTPLPSVPYNLTLASFVGLTPNGSWALFVADQAPLDSGTIVSWSLNITSA